MKWNDSEHPVENLWRKYLEAYKDDIPEPLIKPVRSTFYFGATTMFHLMLEPLMHKRKPSDAAWKRWMDAIEADLNSFRAEQN